MIKILLSLGLLGGLACTEVKSAKHIQRLHTPRLAELPAARSNSGLLNPIVFQKAINQYRKKKGLTLVRYNPKYNWIAARNNLGQRQNKKCGHFFTNSIAQNAASGTSNPKRLLKLWAASPKHNDLLLDKSVRQFGIHSDGHYSTLVMPSRYLGFPKDHP